MALLLCGLSMLPFESRGAAEDCAEALAPQRCQANLLGWRSCQDVADGKRRDCLSRYTPPLSCQRQRDAKRCEALVAAQASCEGMLGAQRRVCIDERLPAEACGRGAGCERPPGLPLAE
ncbi:hypothetical protein DK842_08285 [Chromobacterium phragmitis]|uniref:Uncharacterized protein n=1 Tax=Chromobacterium phragmitis TaxID=2202141 RepID=A0A344UJ27_9NEIS|nr:hypothetical protein [Chromobacterium phragmitis]AXE29885.1 hypothetical protein DK842_08285 [Chromobacterium phragmitis]AXE35275.1 hypothetical protein DK843_13840 [Chromobacterium phragmitis]